MPMNRWIPALLLPLAACASGPDTGAIQHRAELATLPSAGKVAWLDIPAQGETHVPPVVYIHGWAGDGSIWGGQLEAMRGTARQIVIDLPGHGRSDAPRIDYTIPQMADAVLGVMAAAKVPFAILVAHSNGVMTAREVYRKAPLKIGGLVLVDGPLELLMGPGDQAEALIQQLGSPQGGEIAARLISQMLPPTMPAELRREFMQRAGSTPPHVLAATIETTMAPGIWSREPIETPTLVLNAEQPVWTEAYAVRVKELIPGVEYRVLPDTAHFVMLDPPERFNGILQEFCRAQERFPE